MRRIGDNQLSLLIQLGSPTMTLMHPTPEARSLARRGLLLEDHGPRGCHAYTITSAGLRALAAEFDNGRVRTGLQRMKDDAKEARRKIKARLPSAPPPVPAS